MLQGLRVEEDSWCSGSGQPTNFNTPSVCPNSQGLMARGKKDTHPPPTESTATTKASILGKGFEVVVDEVGALREAALMQALAKEVS